VTHNLLLIGGFILLCIWVNIDLIFHILPNGSIYATAKNVVLILGVSQLILATFSICFTALNYSRFYAFSLLFSLILTISAILLNQYFIPILGMEGAALSNLLSYGLYYLLIIVTLVPLCKIQVIDRKWWIILALLVTLFVLNALWHTYLSTGNLWIDSLLRSIVLLGSGMYIAYRAQLSPEISNQVKQWTNNITSKI
jgi:O-antigen/teichoic acid export membrane protein